MVRYRDRKTKLPLPSYDLWEERRGVLTYTASTTYAGLIAASEFADLFGETEISLSYRDAAEEIKAAVTEHLYMKDKGRFARMINFTRDGRVEVDDGIDASLFATFAFGMYPADDEKVESTMQQVHDALWCRTQYGGLARYAGDKYHQVSDQVPGNPWIITTLWLAFYYMARAENPDDLKKGLTLIEWVADCALPSGVLPEQMNPFTGEPLSVSPLTWSHGTFIMAVQEYLNRLITMVRCKDCDQPRLSKYRTREHHGVVEITL
jgi:GH15 family glucan-1,4-alpha-glucosidase